MSVRKDLVCSMHCAFLGVVCATASFAQPQSGTAEVGLTGTVAVVPFANISQEEADDWIGTGIAETVVADLEAEDEVVVVGLEEVATAVRAWGDTGVSDATVAELGRALGANWVVTGGYQRIGNQLRITARLVESAEGTVARTTKVDGTFDEIFALQDRITEGLVASDELTAASK